MTTGSTPQLEPAVVVYLAELVDRTRRILGPDLVGVYLAGSLALGTYEHGRSDIDITLICAAELEQHRKLAIVDALRHESLPCPARGLELVVYRASTAAAGGPAPGFEVELNTGPRMDFRTTYAGTDRRESDGTFWYGIDRSILAECGQAMFGPPAVEVFRPIGDADLLELLVASLRWHLATSSADDASADDAVLNASRALVRVRTGRWLGKRAAGRRLLQDSEVDVGNDTRLPDGHLDPAIVQQALGARDGGRRPSARQARRFQQDVLSELLPAASQTSPQLPARPPRPTSA